MSHTPIEQIQMEYPDLLSKVKWLEEQVVIQSTVIASLIKSERQIDRLDDFIPLKHARDIKGMPSPETLRAWILEGRLTEWVNDETTPHAHYKRHGGKGYILINCEAILRDLNSLAKRKLNHC